MSLTEQVVRAESGAYRIPYFFSASMCKDMYKDLHPNSQDSGRTRQSRPQPVHAGMRDRGDSGVTSEITRG
jgi:hypothetical protein